MGSHDDHTWLLAASGVAFVGLFALGLVAADIVTGSAYPGPSRPINEVAAYVTHNRGAVRWLAFFHGLASMALMLFAIYVGDAVGRAAPAQRVRLGVAVVGGTVAAAFLLLDAVLFWLLVLPATATDTNVLGAVHGLSYLCGGVALTLPLAAFIGATSWTALNTGLLPRWLAWVGVLAAAEGVVYWATVTGQSGAWSPSGVFVTAATVPLLWIAVVSAVLAHNAWVVRRGRPPDSRMLDLGLDRGEPGSQ